MCIAARLRKVAMSSRDLHLNKESGSVEEFAYSVASKISGIVWSPAHMFECIPGTKMFFAGITKEKECADLVAFLSEATCLSSSSSFVVAWCPSIGCDK